jgi:hypothetical protein
MRGPGALSLPPLALISLPPLALLSLPPLALLSLVGTAAGQFCTGTETFEKVPALVYIYKRPCV